jgi:hypothetical protein
MSRLDAWRHTPDDRVNSSIEVIEVIDMSDVGMLEPLSAPNSIPRNATRMLLLLCRIALHTAGDA